MARPWSPSLVLIDRITARCSICRASFGRCSLIARPGTLVSIGLNGPAVGVARLEVEGVESGSARPSSRAGCTTAAAAGRPPPRRPGPRSSRRSRTPPRRPRPGAATGGGSRRSIGRRTRDGARSWVASPGLVAGDARRRAQWFSRNSGLLSSAQNTSARAFRRSPVGAAAIHVGDQPGRLLGPRPPAQGGEEEGLDPARRVEEGGLGDGRQRRAAARGGSPRPRAGRSSGRGPAGSTSAPRSASRPGGRTSRGTRRGASPPRRRTARRPPPRPSGRSPGPGCRRAARRSGRAPASGRRGAGRRRRCPCPIRAGPAARLVSW